MQRAHAGGSQARRGKRRPTSEETATLFRSPQDVFQPETIAIVGASDSGPASWSKALFENLRAAEFPGRVYLINPRRETLWGLTCYPNFAEIPETIDLALVVVAANAVLGVLEDGADNGLRAAVLYAGGFAVPGDPEGERRKARLAELCAEPDGLRVCGPNGMGALSFRERALLYPASRVRRVPAGEVGVVFSSGGSLQHWLYQAAWRGLGFTYAVSAGDELDLGLTDYLQFMLDDEHTRIICALVEGVRRPDEFMQVARRALAARKPLLVVKIGRSPAASDAVTSHTGALAGDDVVFSAVCERYGIVRCATLDDLIDTALAFRSGRIPAGSRVGMVCHSGGIKGLFLDEAAAVNLEIPPLDAVTGRAIHALEATADVDNPFDAGATLAEQSERYKAVCRAFIDDPNIDLVTVQGRMRTDTPPQHPPEVFAELAAATEKPLIAFERISINLAPESRDYQVAATIPFLLGIPQTTRALRALTDYGERTRRGLPLPLPPLGDEPPPADLEATIRAALADAGVTLPADGLAANPDEAVAIAARLGYPVAVKIVSRDITHKTEFDAVRVGLASADAVRAAIAVMTSGLGARHPGVAIDGWLVQAMATGRELLVGARDDPQFGPILVVGLGGIFAEALNDTAVRLLPVERSDVRAMLDELRGGAILHAFRGQPACDLGAIVDAAVGIGDVFLRYRDHLADLEVNPLIAGADGTGVSAVDVRLVVRTAGALAPAG